MTDNATLATADISVAADGTVTSLTYHDIYASRQGALAQARHVFLAGNGLIGDDARWCTRERFVILETGFGIGINFLATWHAWRQANSSGQLHFVSIEQHPVANATLTALLGGHTELADLSQQLLAVWPLPLAGVHRLHFPADRLSLTLVFGEAGDQLNQLLVAADAVYLDGFSPRQNPAMWSPRVVGAVTRLCAEEATLATWCVAGEVRRQLAYRGWQLERTPGLVGKRHMLRGKRSQADSAVSPRLTFAARQPRRAIIIGAGLAGCALTARLAERGWQIALIEQNDGPAMAASGNPAGILLPRLALDDALAARLARSAFLYALHSLRAAGDHARWDDCGVLQLAADADDEAYQRAVIAELALPAAFAEFLDKAAAQEHSGIATRYGGWWFPGGAWVAPASLCAAWLTSAGSQLQTHYGSRIERIRYTDGCWQALDPSGQLLASAEQLVLANAHAAIPLLAGHPTATLPLEAIRGQVSFLPASEFSALRHVICGPAYVTPPAGGFACVGATFDRNDPSLELRPEDHRRNLAELGAMLPGVRTRLNALESGTMKGRVGFRCMSRDKLPLVGQLPTTASAPANSPTLDNLARLPGLHCLLGLGARGMLWAPLAAELLASQMSGDPLPLEKPLVSALDPARFYLRELHRSQPTRRS